MPPAFSDSRNTGTLLARGVLEPAHHRLALADRGAAVQELGGYAGAREVLLQQPGHGDVLGEDQHRTALGEHGADQLVDQLELLGAAAEPRVGLLEVVRRVVADLLERGEQRQHQPAAGVLVGALDPVHRVADHGLVEHHLLAGQPERCGRSRSWPAAPGRRRGRTCGGAAGTGRSARRTAAPCWARGRTRSAPAHTLRKALRRAEQPGDRPVEDRPELGEVVLHRRAGQRDPGPGVGSGAAPWRSRTGGS